MIVDSINRIAFFTILRKEIKRFLRIWVQTLLPSVVTIYLYLFIFGDLVGGRIGELQGVGYQEFIVPGLIMMAVITNSYANVVASFFGSKFQRNIEEMLVSPISNTTILLGFLSGGVTRGLIVGMLVTVLALFLADIHIFSWTIILIVAFLTAMLFAITGFINGLLANKFDDINIIPTFILTPLTYLGGVFYSLDMLPAFGRTISHANPILYIINAFRYGFLGFSDIDAIEAIWVIGFITLALFLLALWMLSRGIGLKS